MKLLLDESIPRQLSRHFPKRFEVHTAGQMGWAGLENGELITQAAAHGFDALITADQNIEHQQNLDNLPMPVLVLTGYRTRLQDLQPLVPKAVEVLAGGPTNGVYRLQEQNQSPVGNS